MTLANLHVEDHPNGRSFPLVEWKTIQLFVVVQALLLVFCGEVAEASGMGLDRLYQSLGSSVNVTTPGAFHDQAAGYYTGGGFMMRQKSESYQPVNISLPHIGAGCNGIDAYFGSLSFMKGDQLIKLMRNLGSQATTYGFQLALKTMAPQVENLFAQLRKLALDANAMMLEDCRLVQTMYAGVLPKGSAFQQAACTDVRARGNQEGDWFGAQEACKKPEKVVESVEQLSRDNKDLLVGAYNLSWLALSKIEGLNDPEFKELMMTLTGTILSRREGHAYRPITVMSKANDESLLRAYLKGDRTSVFLRCDEKERCLHPKPQKDMEIKAEHALVAQVWKRIDAIKNKYLLSEPFNEEEKAFLNDTVSVPLYKYIQISCAVGSDFLMMEAVEFIALQLLITNFERVLTAVEQSVENLRFVQLDDSVIKEFQKSLSVAKERLQRLKLGLNQGIVHRLNQMITTQEQGLKARSV